MAKATALGGPDLMNVPDSLNQQPRKRVPEPKAALPPVADQTPLQIRIPKAEAKAIKRAALEADQTISEFMLACFHACMKS